MSDIIDCIIDGGYALQLPCPEDSEANEVCWDSMFPDASAWNPQTILSLSADTKRIEELFTAAEGQQHFFLTRFAYARGTGALEIHKNGLMLKHGIDWVEQTSTTFSLAVPAQAADKIIATGYVAIEGLVDVRDTDIYVVNYQAVRDYVGSEELIYAQGQNTAYDGGGAFFQLLTGAAPGTYIDDGINILVPTGGDGSAAWISRTAAITFNTVQEMKDHPSLKIGDFVFTDGYYGAYDFGANAYSIVSAASMPDDGGAYITLPGSNTQAVAMFPGFSFNVHQWGAVGDGVADDTVAIQNAIDTISSDFKGGVLKFPSIFGGGIYKCNLVLNRSVGLEGASRNVVLIPMLDAPVITLDAASNISRVSIKTLGIDGTATQGLFGNQHGIYSKPDLLKKHDTIVIDNCYIQNCGGAGIRLEGGQVAASNTSARIEQFRMIDTTCIDCTNPGLHATGNVGIFSAANCEFKDNGDETVDALSNIVVSEDLPGVPESFYFVSCNFNTDGYAATGSSAAIIGCASIAFQSCLFSELFTGVSVLLGTNSNISVRGCRFERAPASGAIDQCVYLEGVHGFIYDDNKVHSATTGPLGVNLNPFGGFALKNIQISSNCGWGSLTTTTNIFNWAPVSGGSANLMSRNGHVTLTGNPENLDFLYDENGGNNQLVTGDIVVLSAHNSGTVNVTVRHAVGNIMLKTGTNFLINNVNDTMMLMWKGGINKWLEISRSSNT